MIQSDINMSSAYLEIIIGPMFSGKTSKLLEIYKQCKFCNIPVSVINHSSDIRYHETMLSSHDKQMIPCIQSNLINDIFGQQSNALRSQSADFGLLGMQNKQNATGQLGQMNNMLTGVNTGLAGQQAGMAQFLAQLVCRFSRPIIELYKGFVIGSKSDKYIGTY